MLNPHVAALLGRRGILQDDYEAFLSPDYDRDIHDPFLFDDMPTAVERIVRAREAGERISIYGDYDVDGVSAAVILFDVLHTVGCDVSLFFNHREDDGYGLHKHCIDRIAADGATLIITTDSGITNAHEITYAKERGIDTIITDHHTPPARDEDLPPAVAIIHPRVHADRYPWKHLSGGGSAFKFAQALCRSSLERPNDLPGIAGGSEKWLLDLVALSTSSDCVPLQGENRVLVHYGLKVLQKSRRPGLSALMSRVPLYYQRTILEHIQFGIIPLLNAASRMDHAKLAADVLLARDQTEAEEACDLLVELNKQRQRLTQKTLKSVPGSVLANKSIVLAASPSWRLGVLGLVANRLVNSYHKPVILVRIGTPHVGVARSTSEVHIAETFGLLSDFFDRFGGHAGAGGFALKPSVELDAFADALEHITPVAREESNDGFEGAFEVSLPDLTHSFLTDLSRCEPWGPGNPQPCVLLRECSVTQLRTIGARRQWIRMIIIQGAERISARMPAKSVPTDFEEGTLFDIICEARLREWRGVIDRDLTIHSMKYHNPIQSELIFV
ncbi:MAG: single-stranded-DNA-specific exonuclease RecJ [Patescibacteria group bacterium]